MVFSDRILEAIGNVQIATGKIFRLAELESIMEHTVRKCELIGKGEDYIPILFENELSDYLMREEINLRGEMNRCA